MTKKDPELFSLTLHIWYAWCCFNYKPIISEVDEILDAIIWGNSLIKRANKPIFDKKLTQSNIDKVLDIYNPVRSAFYTYEELCEIYGTVIDYLQYCSILAAIPSRWKIELRINSPITPMVMESRIDKLRNGKVKPSRVIYWQLIDLVYIINNSSKLIWQANLKISIDDDDWWRIFPTFIKCVKSTKLRYSQYRVLTSSLAMNKVRHKWNDNISELCAFCNGDSKTIIHLFCHCPKTQVLWDNLNKMI